MFMNHRYLKRGAILSLEAMLYIAIFVILIAMGTFGYPQERQGPLRHECHLDGNQPVSL